MLYMTVASELVPLSIVVIAVFLARNIINSRSSSSGAAPV